ncbi:MAG TPA: hypothetical protein PLL09_11215 [Flavobacterium sp.]|uniref:hypothetical protein n=1 Tax=unclassified Flavobacterium TaxID=196869 RepID=UPI0025C16BEF|nr:MULTISPECIES: hypothetical protein [unclassified Flavobacterium]HRE78381.1 hypothetical protein [Flavobacterium sp.]
MELAKIEQLLEKYFEGETTIAEEIQLKQYFSTEQVAAHLEHYKPLFGFFATEKEEIFTPTLSLKTKKRFTVARISIAASLIFFLGVIAILNYNPIKNQPKVANSELGSFETPEEAFEETQKALALLSEKVNIGMESVNYINEYENSKNLIFKK